MSNGNYKDDGPVYFVNGDIKSTKTGKKYIWSKTFDIDAIKAKLGTSVVNMTITTKKNPKTAEERLIIFKPSDPKFIPKAQGSENNNNNYSNNNTNNNNTSGDDIVL